MSDVVTRWWQALNPAIYLVSVLPGIAVCLLSEEYLPVLIATAGVVLLQHSINLFNDAKDWELGADHDKQDSWVRVHAGNSHTANIHGLLSLSAGTILGLLTLLHYGQIWILLYAAPFVVLGLFYNFGRRPLSYTAAGEWVTGICYGPGVFGSLWFVAGQPVNWAAASGMVAFAALSMSLLFSHQPPQIETDRAAGKHSFAVRYGAERAYRASVVLFAVSQVFLVAAAWLEQTKLIFTVPFTIVAVITAWRIIHATQTSPKRILISASLVLLVGITFSMLARWL